jgi:hypothetical protein
MPEYRFFLSASPTAPIPPTDALKIVTAESVPQAVRVLCRRGQLPTNGHVQWAHFLVWISDEGELRGFESIHLNAVVESPYVSKLRAVINA